MKKSNKKNQQSAKSSKKFYQSLTFIQLAIIIGILLLFLVSPYSGQISFYLKWLECGQKPVSTGDTGFLGAGAVHYKVTSSFNLLRGSPHYFCTPLEAEQAGYSANPDRYEFPNLNR